MASYPAAHGHLQTPWKDLGPQETCPELVHRGSLENSAEVFSKQKERKENMDSLYGSHLVSPQIVLLPDYTHLHKVPKQ